MTLFDLIDKHPAVVTTISVCAVLVAAIFHRTVKLVVDAIVGHRHRRSSNKRVRVATPRRTLDPDAVEALKALDYTREEYMPALLAVSGGPTADVVKAAIRYIHSQRQASS
jgi:hypothetical protein